MSLAARRMHTENSNWISFLWRAAVIVGFGAQLMMLALRTPTGARVIPRALLRAKMVRPRQAAGLLDSVRAVGGTGIPALAQSIQQHVPQDCKLEVVWGGVKSPEALSELVYRIYPRRLSQRVGTAGDPSDSQCRIDWHSDSDIMLTTPGSVTRFQARGTSVQ